MRENHVGSLVVVAKAVEAVMRPRIALVRKTESLGRAIALMRAERRAAL
jgi:hypothetical protein